MLCSNSQVTIHKSSRTLTSLIHMPKAGRLIMIIMISQGNHITGRLLRELACHCFQICFLEKLPKGTQCFSLGAFFSKNQISCSLVLDHSQHFNGLLETAIFPR